MTCPAIPSAKDSIADHFANRRVRGLTACSLRHERMPGWAGPALALRLGALLATSWAPLFPVGVLGTALDRAFARTRPTVRTAAAVAASGVVATVLIAAGNVHGPALAVGTVAGAVAARLRDQAQESR